ncbi:MAG TPA: TetR/AcrR family transcriptional regulator [Gemmatimonadaceae bacterium]|nr:TetR/AcrR family transcriptional regulator [Gemmatimonadaceae bacterium]
MPTRKAKALRWERRPDERPHELLEAALRVFAANGYRNTRLDEVAAAAGVTKGALYHYFSNKEELLLRALDEYQERAFGRLEQALREESGSASARLAVLLRRAFGGHDPARTDVLLLLQGTANEAPEVYRRWLASGPIKGWKLITRVIDEGRASGEFRDDVDAEVAARVVLTGLMGQMMWQRHAGAVPGVRIDQDRMIDSAIEFLLAALRRGH